MKEDEKIDWKLIRNKHLHEYLVFSYIIALLLFGFIIIYITFMGENRPDLLSYTIILLPFLYIIVFFVSKYLDKINFLVVPKKVNYIIFFLFITLITYIIYNLAHFNQYLINFFYFIPIILGTVNFGQKFGLYIAAYCCSNLLFINFTLGDFSSLELDIIIIIIFFWVAWLIGGFIDLEREVQKHLRKLSITDSLTGIANFRHFQNKFDSWFKKAKENEKPLCLALMDIDNLKSFNDSVGHQEGDKLLKNISKYINESLNDNIFFARYGSDEFTLLLYNYDKEAALKKVNSIKAKLKKKLDIPYVELLDKTISFSFGIACFPEQVQDKNKLFDKADQALYQAKSTQKDNIKVYQDALTDIAAELEEPELEKLNSVKTLLSIINAKDKYTYGHSQRVMNYAEKFAVKLKLDSEEKRKLLLGAFLHDIGKIDIPRETLMKPEILNENEWKKIKKHPEIGAQILKPLNFCSDILSMVRYHHENVDGTGYNPDIKGDDIPFYARILRIIDSFDAMITDRPYSSALSIKEAFKELKKQSDIEFDPELVDIFINVIKTEISAGSN
ncbi:MAG: diguanylate cyclase [archaeon]